MGISCDENRNRRIDRDTNSTSNRKEESRNMPDAPINRDTITINEYTPSNDSPLYPDFKPVVETMKISVENKNKNTFENIKEELDKQTCNFYDLILDFSNFEQLKKEGWPLMWGRNGKQKYERCKQVNNVVIGIIGNKNKGKSFLISKFIDNENYSKNEHGFMVTTKGISANFPVIDNGEGVITNVITLDTAGKDNPLLDISNMTDVNNLPKKNKYESEQIKNIARDQRICEIVLADFIIEKSDVLITVLEQLSFAEQEMLKNLLNQLKSKKAINNTVNKKKLIVIHNLMNLTDINSINNFIESTLLKSFTFKLSKRQIQIIKKENTVDDTTKHFYIQKTKDIDNLEIFHLIFGNDLKEEIRKEFNEPAIRFIRDAIEQATQKKFDLIEDFKNFIIQNSQKYISGPSLNQEQIIIKKENDIEQAIVSKDKNIKINLKNVHFNSEGIADFFSIIEPSYSSRIIKDKKEDKYFLEIIFELAGKLKEEIKINCDVQKMKYIISIEGNIIAPKDIKSENIIGNLKFEQFFFQITIDKFFYKNVENDKKYRYIISNIEDKISAREDENFKKDEKNGIYHIILPITIVERKKIEK